MPLNRDRVAVELPNADRGRTVPTHDEAAMTRRQTAPSTGRGRRKGMTISRYGGFTLIEILVAVFILAIVLTTVYTSYTGTLRIVSETGYGDEIYGMARITMKRLTEDLQALSHYKASFTFVSRTGEGGEDAFPRMSFLSSAHLRFDGENSPGIAMISYFVKNDGDSDGYALMRKDVLYKGTTDETESREGGFMLCDRLAALSYTFYDKKGSRYDTWDSDSEIHKQGAPSMVAIRLDFVNPDDADKPYRFMTNVFIPTAGVQ